jgi:hypothetical protein
LEKWLQGLAKEWRTLRDAVEQGMNPHLPTRRMSIRGWLLEFRTHPKSEEARRSRAFPMIGVYTGQAAFEASSAAIVRSRIAEKASHYGDLDATLVIALHDVTPVAGRSVVSEALFGLGRPFWAAGSGSGSRVSAVLAAGDFGMSSVARKTPELWLNPYAADTLPTGVLSWPVVGRVDADSDLLPIDSAVLFDLPSDWPRRPFRRA